MRIATGIDTRAYSNWDKKSGILGIYTPISTPMTMHANTHTVRYRSKKLIPELLMRFLQNLSREASRCDKYTHDE
jgi:hypothetical protein